MFWENYNLLCVKVGKSPNAVAKELDIASGTVTEWKKGKRIPQNATLLKIADYFGVPVESLTAEKEKEKAPTKIEANAIFLEDKKMYMIPLFESVSAGFGKNAIDQVIGYEPCYIPNPADAVDSLCIRVSGDSMSPKIENGDIIQVLKQTSVDSGSVAVVLLDGEEGLVKKVIYGSDWIELHSFNGEYPVMRFEGEDVLRLRVVGLVKAVIKRF